MKTYTDIKTWLASKPNDQEIAKVLELINKSSKREMKVELWKKEKELKKHLKFAEEMKELGYKPSVEMLTKTTELVEEVKELQKTIGPTIKRTKKEEVKEEEVKKEE